MSKYFAAGAVGAAIPLLLNFVWGAASESNGKREGERRKCVGIDIGVANYNVAIGEPIFSNKGDITDFIIHKRKNGITSAEPLETLQDIIKFIKENQQTSAINVKEEQ